MYCNRRGAESVLWSYRANETVGSAHNIVFGNGTAVGDYDVQVRNDFNGTPTLFVLILRDIKANNVGFYICQDASEAWEQMFYLNITGITHGQCLNLNLIQGKNYLICET